MELSTAVCQNRRSETVRQDSTMVSSSAAIIAKESARNTVTELCVHCAVRSAFAVRRPSLFGCAGPCVLYRFISTRWLRSFQSDRRCH